VRQKGKIMFNDLFKKFKDMYKKYNTPRYWYLPSSPNDLSIARNKLINILSELQEQRDINNLPILYWALIDKELGLQVEIAKVIHTIFSKYTVSKYTLPSHIYKMTHKNS
jgi:hypothetical protein